MDNGTQIQTDVDLSIFDAETPIEFVTPTAEPAVEDEIFPDRRDHAFVHGRRPQTFRNWVMQNVKFPQIALENGIHGRVILSFVIDKDGRLTNIEVLQSPDRSLADEAIRVLNKSPKWSPGQQRNQTVRVRYTLPVEFRVQKLRRYRAELLRVSCFRRIPLFVA